MEYTKNATLPLVVVNILVFMLQLFLGAQFSSSFVLVSDDILTRPWIILTSMFMHAGAFHLFFNMYALLAFGTLVEHKIGTKRFLLLYFGSGIIAAIAFAIFTPHASAVGASGAIMGILGLTMVLMPEIKVLFFYIIPMSIRVAGIFFALIDLFAIVPGVANTAHLGGLAAGLLYGWVLSRKKQKIHRVVSSKSHLEKEDIEEYLRSGRI